jgi:5-methylthioadenosine/S-adenosylhomocysteine deaminase
MRARGIAVGLGSDGEKENNNLDLLEEMKFASLLAKLTALDPTAGDHWSTLELATTEGARALGLGAVSGSLEPGKRADVVVVDLGGMHTTPLLRGDDDNVVAHLVFASRASDVRDVWVDGRRLVADRAAVTFDPGRIQADAQAAAEELFDRRRKLQVDA